MDSKNNLILSTAYFPPVQYFVEISKHENTYIENHENYIKQSYRNRCVIYSANGLLALSIPVRLGSFHKVNIRDIRIDNSRSWQTNHFRAIKAAYRSSAFYEFYMDDLNPFFSKKFDFLVDLNHSIILNIRDLLGIDKMIFITENYRHIYNYADDMRYMMHPKKESVSDSFTPPTYFQVFGTTGGFKKNISIIDLLFNMGPESYGYLKSC